MPLNYRTSNIVPLNYRASTTLPVYYTTHSAVPLNYSDDSYTYVQTKSALSSTPVTTIVSTKQVPASNFHIVQAGETLASIADLYGLTTYELALWNDITSPYTVYSGQRLLIVSP